MAWLPRGNTVPRGDAWRHVWYNNNNKQQSDNKTDRSWRMTIRVTQTTNTTITNDKTIGQWQGRSKRVFTGVQDIPHTKFTGVHSKWHAALPPFRCWCKRPTPPPLTVCISGFYKIFPWIITNSNNLLSSLKSRHNNNRIHWTASSHSMSWEKRAAGNVSSPHWNHWGTTGVCWRNTFRVVWVHPNHVWNGSHRYSQKSSRSSTLLTRILRARSSHRFFTSHFTHGWGKRDFDDLAVPLLALLLLVLTS